MITHACVKFYTKEYYKTPWDESSLVPSKCYTIPCHRHGDAFRIIAQFLDADEIDNTKTEQGFLTHDGTFLNRYSAYLHAAECGQMPVLPTLCLYPELYSEDLW